MPRLSKARRQELEVLARIAREKDELELLTLTRRMLDAMYSADPSVHAAHCADDLTSYEWFIAPQRIDGVSFHLKLIEDGGNGAPSRLDMLTPSVQIYNDDAAIVCYTLLKTEMDDKGPSRFSTINETRVFVKLGGVWKMAHLHKSPTQ